MVEPVRLSIRKALVADDLRSAQMLLEAMLESRGYDVTLATTSEQVFQALSSRTFDIVFLDVWMPPFSGPEYVRMVKDKARAARLVAVTANENTDLREAVIGAGADELLIKPVMPASLIDALGETSRPPRNPA